MPAAVFSRGRGRAMGSVLNAVAAIDFAQTAFRSVAMDGAEQR